MNNILITEIDYVSPINIFSHFANLPWAMLLHSENYSFIAVDPFLTLTSKNQNVTINQQTVIANPFTILQSLLKKYPLDFQTQLMPLQNGIVGYFGYDLCQHLEVLPRHATDDLAFLDMALGFYDLIIGFNHQQQQAQIFSSGLPEIADKQRQTRAQQRTQWLQQQLSKNFNFVANNQPLLQPQQISANFTRECYIKSVQKVIDYIYAGDIFQANISQRFLAPWQSSSSAWQLFNKLYPLTHAPFSSYLNLPNTTIVSASPERFLQLNQRQVITSPIKGTRPRSPEAIEDTKLAAELINSDKDNAENIMIVDLLRNDLSRVCKNYSVVVKQLCQLQSFQTVHHLVSTIAGELQTDKTAVDLLMATFPGGSITGAPKIRAMEIIAEIEPTQRGPYCGCIGYINFNGDMETAITIRTFAIKDNKIVFQVGGGIVADSNPTAEYEETLTKATALIKALVE